MEHPNWVVEFADAIMEVAAADEAFEASRVRREDASRRLATAKAGLRELELEARGGYPLVAKLV